MPAFIVARASTEAAVPFLSRLASFLCSGGGDGHCAAAGTADKDGQQWKNFALQAPIGIISLLAHGMRAATATALRTLAAFAASLSISVSSTFLRFLMTRHVLLKDRH